MKKIRKTLPELPDARKERYMRCFGLSSEDAVMMTNDKDRSDYFEAVVKAGADPKAAVNWLMGEFASQLSTDGNEIAAAPVTSENLAELLKLISKGTISGKIAKKVFAGYVERWRWPGKARQSKRSCRLVIRGGGEGWFCKRCCRASTEAVCRLQGRKREAVGRAVGQII
ncbi:MAG: hypothetical protein ACLVHE_04115 [Dialister invisus]